MRAFRKPLFQIKKRKERVRGAGGGGGARRGEKRGRGGGFFQDAKTHPTLSG